MARFMRAGTTRFYFVPTIAATTTLIPTVAEVTAGTRIDAQIATVNGFSFANQPIKTPDMASTFESSIPGKDAADDSSLEMYQVKGTDSIRTALAKGTAGYMVIFFDGIAGSTPAIADKVDTFPCQVASNAKMYTADNEAAKYRVVFTITDPPKTDLAIAA